MEIDLFESMKNQIYNLNLYLLHIETAHPEVYAQLNSHFDGMPGYSGTLAVET